ncbi:hypothetical protein Sste5346_009104 [Sporothrix stenoceras]|uniref:Arylsulfatase n=1 Tax=Sporothrix stenoceras TaxID=5173 RepID=A0ABR3YMT5_9PEZI
MHLNLQFLTAAGLLASMASAKQPNFVFILTDDQDTHMNSLDHMPFVQKHLMYEGTHFPRHYCTMALCCPSRVSLLTGMAAHNTNVTDIWPPYGGYPKFVDEGHNEAYLPIFLQEAGYNTYYSGKLFNAHSLENYNKPPAGGWTESEFLLDPHTYEYDNAHFTLNAQPPRRYKGQYSPDVTAQKAYGFLEKAIAQSDERPFFVGIAPIASHGHMTQYPFKAEPPMYADRHAHLFKDYAIPRTDNFNPPEDENTGVSWVARLPRLNDTVLAYNDEYQRCRLRSLQSVDEMVDEIVHRLEQSGLLDNTYIFYTTDNGYHISQHRMHPGKTCGFETDINVPMIVRGPGVERNHRSLAVTSHLDITPTIMSLAGAPARKQYDGSIMPIHPMVGNNVPSYIKKEHVGIEYWGLGGPEGKYGYKGNWGRLDGEKGSFINNTFKSIRLIGDGYNLYYSVWCTNEVELYDMRPEADSGQIHNLLHPREAKMAENFAVAGRELGVVLGRLDAALSVLADCKGATCREPWATIHSKSKFRVRSADTFLDALDPEFDYVYAAEPHLRFNFCPMGHVDGYYDKELYSPSEKLTPFGDKFYAEHPLAGEAHWTELI